MFQYYCLNPIAEVGLNLFDDNYEKTYNYWNYRKILIIQDGFLLLIQQEVYDIILLFIFNCPHLDGVQSIFLKYSCILTYINLNVF